MQDTFDIHKWKTYQMFLNESDDDFTFTDTDKDLANKLNKELKVGSIITPDMWDKEALKHAIDYLIAADSPDLANRYKELTKKPHKISGLFNSDIVPGDGYYKIVFTNGTSIHSSNLESEFNVFESLQENDDFEFTDTDKDLAADLDVVELTIGDTITPDMWTDVFKKGETLKKYQIKSLKSSPHKITNIEVIGDDRVLMFGEMNGYYYTNEFLKPKYRVVLSDNLDEQDDDFTFTDTDKSLAASMYADQVVSKYDVIIDIDQEVDVRLRKPLTDDFILKLLKRPLSLESTSIECTISVSNRVSLISLLNYLNISEDVYSQWITPNLELDAGLTEENLNDLVDETISTHVHSLWDDNFEEGDFQINNVVIDYSEMSDDVLKLAKSNAFRKALEQSVIEQIMSPSFYSGGQENVFADYVHYDWNIRVVPNTLNELDDDFTFTSTDKDLASSLSDEVILEPGYVFTGDEIKDDKSLKARLTGKTITRYYTRKSPLLNSRDQIMMDIKDVSGKEIQYVLSKLKSNYFVPDKVYDLKLGEEYK